MGTDQQLSPNFGLDELTRSQTALRLGILNNPTPAQVENLRRLCAEVLEPARAILGVPLHVDSGFRCKAVNDAVGSNDRSEHLLGCAADVIPAGLDLQAAFDKLRASGLPFDQIIFECRAWIHLGIRPAGSDLPNRHQALIATGGPGAWHYLPAPPLAGGAHA